MAQAWLLLIYTVPAKPTSKRAFIWREIKKAGAIYLRDGVCALPAGEGTSGAFQAIAAKVQEFEGDAILIEGCQLPPERSTSVVSQMIEARAKEYADLVHDATVLTHHLEREREHRIVQRVEFEGDLGKLRRWFEQIRARDYFGAPQALAAHETLVQCTARLASLADMSPQGGYP